MELANYPYPVVLDQISPSQLPELQGWHQKMQKAIKQNPYVAITDGKSYQIAKKHRTALVSARTDVQKQEKLIASKLKAFRDKVGQASLALIAMTLPYEQKQQQEVQRYEAQKQREKEEKQRIERERKAAIKKQIEDTYTQIRGEITALSLSQIASYQPPLTARLQAQDAVAMEEFELDWHEKRKQLARYFNEKQKDLEEKEARRIEADRLAQERRKIQAEREALEQQLEQHQAQVVRLQKEREAIEAEKHRLKQEQAQRVQKAEAEHQAKAAEAQKAKEAAAAKKRAEQLKPDKEKLEQVIASMGIQSPAPELSDPSCKNFYSDITSRIEALREELHTELLKLH